VEGNGKRRRNKPGNITEREKLLSAFCGRGVKSIIFIQ
jgi:hypothetical protein